MQTKYAVVSGAGKGIGRAIAATLATNGYSVIACARTLADLESLKAQAPTIIPFVADLGTADGVNALVSFVKQTCNCPQVIVNNLGVYVVDSVLDTSETLLEQQLQLNFYSTYRLTQPFVNAMQQRGSGHIVVIGSVASIRAVEGASAYSISKHAQLGYSRALAADLKGSGVYVTAILPSSVDTASWDGYTGDRSKFIQPQQIANLTLAEIAAKRSAEYVLENE